MSKKVIIIILIIIFGGLYVISFITENNASVLNMNNTTEVSLKVVSGPIKLQEMITDIRTRDYYAGYDEETLRWMERLGDKDVFITYDELVIMNHDDADKIPVEDVTDVSITYNIKCKLLDHHSLGNKKYPKNVMYVCDVDYMGKDIKYYDV